MTVAHDYRLWQFRILVTEIFTYPIVRHDQSIYATGDVLLPAAIPGPPVVRHPGKLFVDLMGVVHDADFRRRPHYCPVGSW
jgi:hypothetical protein